MPPLAIGQSSVTFNVDTSLVSQALSNVDLNLGTFERRAAALETFLVRTSGRLAASEAYASGLARFRAGARARGWVGVGGPMEDEGGSRAGRMISRKFKGVGRGVARLGAGMLVGQIITESGIGEGDGFAGFAQRVGTSAAMGMMFGGGPAGAAIFALSAVVMGVVNEIKKEEAKFVKLADDARKIRTELLNYRLELRAKFDAQQKEWDEQLAANIYSLKKRLKEERHEDFRLFAESSRVVA